MFVMLVNRHFYYLFRLRKFLILKFLYEDEEFDQHSISLIYLKLPVQLAFARRLPIHIDCDNTEVL